MTRCEAEIACSASAGLALFQSRVSPAFGSRDYWAITLKGKTNPAFGAGLGVSNHAGNRAPIARIDSEPLSYLLKEET